MEEVFWACESRSEENIPADKIECNRWSDAEYR